jgi:hypothetical protein
MKAPGTAALRRIMLEILGWLLVLGGIAALVLPGPGLLMLFAGLVILSQEYEWAEKRLEPVERMALRAAAEGVETWPRIALSTLGGLCIIAVGIAWGVHPDAPGWWPVRDSWWLAGGWATGTTLIASGLIALGLLAYSYRRFRVRGEPVPEPTDSSDD